jgi:hypothetical protein
MGMLYPQEEKSYWYETDKTLTRINRKGCLTQSRKERKGNIGLIFILWTFFATWRLCAKIFLPF